MISKIKGYFLGKNSLISAATILVVTTFLSNIFGLVRDRVFAEKITPDLLDTYFAAFRVPDFIFNILILGSVSAAFIPVFIDYLEKDEKEAWKIAQINLNLILIIMIGLSIVLYALMPNIIPYIVPEFSPEKKQITTELARILMLQPIFFGVSYLLSGILNGMKRFLVYSFAPLIYTTAIIATTLLYADEFGVYALAWGVILGSFLHMAIQFIVARNIGFKLGTNLDFSHPAIKKIIRLMIPRSIGLGALQVNLLVFTAIASTLGPGSVAIYNFADNIQTMPVAVFGLSFITAMFPTLSEKYAQKNYDSFAKLVWRGIRYMLVILVPAGIGLILLRAEIIRLILGTDLFDWQTTIQAANTLGFFALSLTTFAIASLLARAFYAAQDTLTPTIYNIVSYVVIVILGYYFSVQANMGVPGLALGFSIGNLFYCIALYFAMRSRIPELKQEEKELFPLILKLILGVFVLIASVQLLKFVKSEIVGDLDTWIKVAARTGLAILVGASSYCATMWALKVPEIKFAFELIIARFWPSRKEQQYVKAGFEDLTN